MNRLPVFYLLLPSHLVYIDIYMISCKNFGDQIENRTETMHSEQRKEGRKHELDHFYGENSLACLKVIEKKLSRKYIFFFHVSASFSIKTNDLCAVWETCCTLAAEPRIKHASDMATRDIVETRCLDSETRVKRKSFKTTFGFRKKICKNRIFRS